MNIEAHMSLELGLAILILPSDFDSKASIEGLSGLSPFSALQHVDFGSFLALGNRCLTFFRRSSRHPVAEPFPLLLV